MKDKKSVVSTIIKWMIFVLFLAFIVVICLRKYIFDAGSFLYTLYDEEFAENLVNKLLKVALVVMGGFDLVQLANVAINAGIKTTNNNAKTVLLLAGNALKYLSIILIILISLSAIGIDTTAIVTGAGVLTLCVSLGCQSMISDIVAGIFLILEGDIKVGDIVVINGWRGTVRVIGLRRTKIEDSVGNINIVSNSSISNIINNTRELSLAIIVVGIEYNESIERVENVLKENFATIKKNIPAIIEGPFYKGVEELGASSVNIKILAKVNEEDKYQVERDLNREIKILFDKNNINIPFDQIVVNYRPEDETTAEITAEEIRSAKKFLEEQKELSRDLDEQNG